MYPTFLIIGAPKAGTTSLWYLLRQHPEIFMPEKKEIGFFSFDSVYARGGDWYQSLFDGGAGKASIGEATPNYSCIDRYPDAPKRIAKHISRVQLIYIVRHPLDRIESAWLQCLYTGHRMPRTFQKAVREYRPLIESTLYYRNLQEFRQYFSEDQILLLFLEDLRANPNQQLRKCFEFLGVSSHVLVRNAESPRNESAGRTLERAIFSVLRGSSLVDSLKNMVPKKAIQLALKYRMKPLPARPNWDPETRAYVRSLIGDDAKAVLAYGGKPVDFWNLSCREK